MTDEEYTDLFEEIMEKLRSLPTPRHRATTVAAIAAATARGMTPPGESPLEALGFIAHLAMDCSSFAEKTTEVGIEAALEGIEAALEGIEAALEGIEKVTLQ